MKLKDIGIYLIMSLIFFISFILLNLLSTIFQIESSITPWYLPAGLYFLYIFYFNLLFIPVIFLSILTGATLFFGFDIVYGAVMASTITTSYYIISRLIRHNIIVEGSEGNFEYNIFTMRILKVFPIVTVLTLLNGIINAIMQGNNEINFLVRVILFSFGDSLGIMTLGTVVFPISILWKEFLTDQSSKIQGYLNKLRNFIIYMKQRMNNTVKSRNQYFLLLFVAIISTNILIVIGNYVGISLYFLIVVPYLINSFAKSELQFLSQFGFTNLAVFSLLVFNQLDIAAIDYLEFQLELYIVLIFSITVYIYNTNLRKEQYQRAMAENQLIDVQQFEALGRLAGGVAHDFNNLMQVISNEIELLKMDLHEDSNGIANVVDALNVMELSIDKGKGLIKQILNFGQFKNMDLEKTDLENFIEERTVFFNNLFKSSQTLKIRSNPVPDIYVDKVRMEQVLVNLLTNARDELSEDGTVMVSIEYRKITNRILGVQRMIEPGEYVTVSVRDNGNGISNEVQKKIFEPFFTTKETGKGTGLGLAIVLGIITAHNADLTLQTGKGFTDFTIYLPVAYDIGIENQSVIEMSDKNLDKFEVETLTDNFIVIIDDNKPLLRSISSLFKKLGLNFRSYNDPIECLIEMTDLEHAPDILITDIVMPNVNGLSLASSFKSYYPDVNIIMMTGYPKNILHKEIDFEYFVLHKPFTFSSLLVAIQKSVKIEN